MWIVPVVIVLVLAVGTGIALWVRSNPEQAEKMGVFLQKD